MKVNDLKEDKIYISKNLVACHKYRIRNMILEYSENECEWWMSMMEYNKVISAEFTQIAKPVTWQEAIEAWVNGKKVKSVDANNIMHIYESKEKRLLDNNGVAVTKFELLNYKWYIED